MLAAAIAAVVSPLAGGTAVAADPTDLKVWFVDADANMIAGIAGDEVRFVVQNEGPTIATPVAVVTLPFAGTIGEGTGCAQVNADITCTLPPLAAGGRHEVTLRLTPPATVADVASGTMTLRVAAADPTQTDPDTADNTTSLLATLEPAPAVVGEISGSVRDSADTPIGEAVVVIEDELGTVAEVATDPAGFFVFRNAEQPKPLRAGKLRFVARKDGYQPATATVRGDANPLLDVDLVFRRDSAAPADGQTSTSRAPETATTPLKWPWVAAGSAGLLASMLVAAILLARRARAERRRTGIR